MRIVKDLGAVDNGRGRRRHKYLVECAKCKKHFAMRKDTYEGRRNDLCAECRPVESNYEQS